MAGQWSAPDFATAMQVVAADRLELPLADHRALAAQLRRGDVPHRRSPIVRGDRHASSCRCARPAAHNHLAGRRPTALARSDLASAGLVAFDGALERLAQLFDPDPTGPWQAVQSLRRRHDQHPQVRKASYRRR